MDLHSYRTKIDELDDQLIALLAERFLITQKVGEYKKLHHLTAIDPDRESLQFNRYEKLAKSYNLDTEFVKNLMRSIIDEVVKNHNRISRQN